MRSRFGQYRYQWRPMKRRFRLSSLNFRKSMLLVFILLLQCLAWYFFFRRGAQTHYSAKGPKVDYKGDQIVYYGEYKPVQPELLGGFQTTRHTYTSAELDAKFGNMDFIYTFVNGSERNHALRREFVLGCVKLLQKVEEDLYYDRPPRAACTGAEAVYDAPTNRDVLKRVSDNIVRESVSARDRERDELRYSIRSIEKHMRWHRGRLIIVSPGHHPLWIDAAKNFFSSACRSDVKGAHRRITTVHQDAIMPYGMRLTIDSHSIEMQLFRVRHITPIHVFFNDDYFIYRDVDIIHLLNRHGGTFVRTERHIISKAVAGDNSSSWTSGVFNTNLFNAHELDHTPEDFIPPALLEEWRKAGYVNGRSIPVSNKDTLVHTARSTELEERPKQLIPKHPRFFATHAPFVYCTRMFEYLNTRYAREIAHNALKHRSRRAKDLFVPFVYNAFIMTRPWQASPRFLPHVAALHASRRAENPGEAPRPINIELDNMDGCAPATILRKPASETVFTRFTNEDNTNRETLKELKKANPLFFNVNDDFDTLNATIMLQTFLQNSFPDPVFVERTETEEVKGEQGHQKEKKDSAPQGKYRAAYDALMELPLVILTSYSEAFCPMVRSVHLALQEFRGPIVLARAPLRNGPNGMDDDIARLRASLHHRVRSAVPVTKCTFNSRVSIVHLTPGASLAEETREALAQSGAAQRAFRRAAAAAARLPGDYEGPGDAAGRRVGAFVVDARATHALDNAAALARALQVPGQTLALEDFAPLEVPGEEGVALTLALRDAEWQGVHWINGAAEEDVLLAFPLPSETYEDLDADVKWSI